MTEADKREQAKETKDDVGDEPGEATRHEDHDKGGAEEVHPEGGGVSGGVKDNVQDEFKEAQRD